MSYARFGEDSAVYVYSHAEGGLVCHGCSLPHIRETFRVFTPMAMLLHLLSHLNHGHRVPARTFDRLYREWREAQFGV